MKLYPPYLNGSIPAFTGDILNIPFLINKTVHPDEFIGFQILIKDLFNNTVATLFSSSYDLTNHIVYFDIAKIKSKFIKGQFYKIQIAYVDQNKEIGYYSTIGITKCTTAPLVKIERLSLGALNGAQTEYVGSFQQEDGNDLSEKLYSSYFVLQDLDNNIIFKTEEKIHNSSEDDLSNIQKEVFHLNYKLNDLTTYLIYFCTKSLNGVVTTSPRYEITKARTIDADFTGDLIAENNFENGYIDIYLKNCSSASISGTFLLSRIDLKDQVRFQIRQFRFEYENPNTWHYRDFTCEQGKYYQYTIQQFNEKYLHSNDMLSNLVYADFEHMYLTDGEKQLKINFNPQINSFKSNVLESKIETIGSQYPFFFRNAQVNYKEFPIGGLIACVGDEDNLFLNFNNKKTQQREETSSLNLTSQEFKTNLVSENFEKERDWKLNVLDWLNNGKVKLFKSAAEGNYLVRLMNVSLSPQQQLGRMLHSFTATAYEIDAINEDTLNKYGLLDLSYPEPTLQTWSTWNLQEYLLKEFPAEGLILNTEEILGISVTGLRPGDTFDILFSNSETYETIMIGGTGKYFIDNVSIAAIRIPKAYPGGAISYKHWVNGTRFDQVSDIKYHPSIAYTHFGYNYQNIFYLMSTIKYEINRLHFLNFEKIPIEEVSQKPDNLDNELIIYHFVDPVNQIDEYRSANWKLLKDFSLDNCYNIQYNNDVISLEDKLLLDYDIDIQNINSINLKIGYGIKLNIGIAIKEVIFLIEETDKELQELKQKFLTNKTETSYKNFINTLELKLKRGTNLQ